ncbi:MAG: glycosyltransferase, partial [Candidatus Omnitrophica bacterium]|nr:glycosyltransferase [Candidatus Omnitrophota bacterium]
MNIQIITSSYPAFAGDPGGTAGLFVEAFACELQHRGHTVIVQPVQRKTAYTPARGITIEPIPWDGGDQVLSTMNIYDPRNWPVFWNFFKNGRANTAAIHKKHAIDHTLCMWVIPSGIFGYWIFTDLGKNYDVWALGSDIWKIRHIPVAGERLIKKVVHNAAQVYADGQQLCADVSHITDRDCSFLSSSRVLPAPSAAPLPQDKQKIKLLFVGRYHTNKGPDLLLDALLFLEEDVRAKIQVDIFGLGELEGELHTACQENGLETFVKMHGPINAQDLANRLQEAQYLLIPS